MRFFYLRIPKQKCILAARQERGDTYRERLITANGVDILLEGLGDLSYFIAVQALYECLNLKNENNY